MTRQRLISFVICMVVTTLQLFAQPEVLLQQEGVQRISPNEISWLADKEGKRSLSDVQRLDFDSLPDPVTLNDGKELALWAHFVIRNNTGIDQAAALRLFKSGYATAYVKRGDRIDTFQTGSLLPLHARSVPSNLNAFRIPIPRDAAITVWIRFESRYSLYRPRSYDLALSNEAHFIAADKARLLWQGIFLGVIAVMILYNFLIGVAVKDLSYLYYVLSIVGIGTYFAFYYGFGIEYLWPNAPYWDTFCYLLIVPFSGLMRLLFTRTYLHTPVLLPNINFLMNGLITINVLVMSAGCVAYFFKIDIIRILIDVIGFTGTAVHSIMLIAGVVAFREHYRPAKYFIWANLILVVGAVLFIGRELNILEDNFFTRYLVQIGFLVQVVVFSLGMASRLNGAREQLSRELLEKERLALDREREKKELIEEQRKNLLVQVAQQTRDLKQQNVELERSFALVKESEHRQVELNEVKNKLFSVISHDLRNPLATMQSFIKLITEHQHKLTEEENKKLYAQAQQSLDNLNMLMYNLLQWSRSQMNLLDYKAERVLVRALLQNAANALQLNAQMKEISVHLEAPDAIAMYADKEMVEFVVRNLLSNAIKFSHRHGEVVLRGRQEGDSVLVEVCDHGIGMNEIKLHKLLATNSTLTRRGTEKEKGTGLGLLICKEFIEKNKGHFHIMSEPGKRSVFSFSVPVFAMKKQLQA